MKYDAIVIGSGQAGTPLSQAIAAQGKTVALIEQAEVGGTCVNTGCTPTKTLVASAQVAHYCRNSARWGVHASNISTDLPAILARKQKVVMGSRMSQEKKIAALKTMRLYRGEARFTGTKTIQVGDESLESDWIFINTGCRPAIPAIEGVESVDYLTNASLLELKELPSHLLVLGGGYVGLEFAQIYLRLGSKVTVVQSGPRILPTEDEDITDSLTRSLESEGIEFRFNSRAGRVEKSNRTIVLTMDTAEGELAVSGSHLLLATGRVPNTERLAPGAAGLETDAKGYVKVNDRLETNVAGIWALGDVKGGPAFTHISYNDYQIVYGNLFEGKSLSTATRMVPYAVYTDPQLGRVGMTEKAARAKGLRLKIGKVEMTHVARAIERDETNGLMKLVVDADSDKILGAAILASEGGELVQILSTLMLADKPYTLLKGAIYIHPTLAEGFFGLMESVKPA